MGELGAAIAGGVVAWVAGKGALRWARRRCDEALAAAHRLPAPGERTFILVANPRPDRRARVRHQRALQQALDAGRRDGALRARRTVPSVREAGGHAPDRS